MSSYIEMNIIAVEVTRSKHGSFLKHVANAWNTADPGNKLLMEQLWRSLIRKYDLAKEYSKEIAEHRHEYEVVLKL